MPPGASQGYVLSTNDDGVSSWMPPSLVSGITWKYGQNKQNTPENDGQWSGGCLAGDSVNLEFEYGLFNGFIISVSTNSLVFDDGSGYIGYLTRVE